MLLDHQLKSDFSKFADLDSNVIIGEIDDDWLISFAQNGEKVELRADKFGGRVIERRDDETLKHASYLGLLASPGFGNLKRLAAAQVALLMREAPYIKDIDQHLPIVGELESPETRHSTLSFIERIEHWLLDKSPVSNEIRALVIDGPAGIGKTHLIRRLSYERALGFGPGSSPPLLHVQSRGRKLTTLNDVLAGTLNTLRVGLTFDQVPLLVRYGLLQVAIDGFDELADPYGYENAWGLVLEFCQMIRGDGVLILAGRDTFIDVNAVRNALSLLNSDNTSAAHLRALTGGEAMGWLSENGWKDDQLTKMREASLFEEDSYALRPFFISEIARFRDDYGMFDGFIDFPLASLVDSIVRREVKLLISFMPDVDESKLAALLNQFFQEVARTMSDAETDRLDLSSIQLICEMVFGGSVSEEAVAVLRHRVSAFALLEQDLSPDDRRFSHSEIQDFFLAQNYIQLIISGQSSKSLSRNIIGSDLLDTFYEITSRLSLNDYSRFYFAANLRLTEAPSVTQEGKNILALILATAERFREIDASPAFPGFTLDELCLRGELASCELVHGTISLLDARGCDFSAMRLNDVGITTLLADDATRTPATMPEPYNLQLVRSGRVDSIYDPKERGAWLEQHRPPAEGSIEVSEKWQLLLRIARVVNRQKWIRDVEDDLAGRLLQNPLWPSVREVLENRNLLLVRESVDASGPRSSFYRLLQADDFLSPKLSGVAAEVQRALSK